LGKRPLIENEKKLASIRPEALNRMREACREEPEVAFCDVADKNRSIRRIEDRYSGVAVKHVGPLVCRVPMQFAIAACCKAHGDAGQVQRRREFPGRDLSRPSSVLDTAMSEIKGIPDRVDDSSVGNWRFVGVWVHCGQGPIDGA